MWTWEGYEFETVMRMHIAGTVVLECVAQCEGSEASYECIPFCCNTKMVTQSFHEN